jgi:hypothetical protein
VNTEVLVTAADATPARVLATLTVPGSGTATVLMAEDGSVSLTTAHEDALTPAARMSQRTGWAKVMAAIKTEGQLHPEAVAGILGFKDSRGMGHSASLFAARLAALGFNVRDVVIRRRAGGGKSAWKAGPKLPQALTAWEQAWSSEEQPCPPSTP